MSTYSKGKGECVPERIDPRSEPTQPYGDDPGPWANKRPTTDIRPQHGGARAGSGRPRQVQDGMQVTVLLPQDLLDVISKLMAERCIASRGEAIRVILKEALNV